MDSISSTSSEVQPVDFRKAELEPFRRRLKELLEGIPAAPRHDSLTRVKAKELSSFLGTVNCDLARMSIEAFPPELNKKIASLSLLPRIDFIWY